MLRYVNWALCLLMILFTTVQYNDPDGLLWMVIYMIPAVWTGIAAARIDLLSRTAPMILLGICVIAAAFTTVYYWPTIPGWWRREVWWQEETAREGLGIMIVLVALLSVFISGWSARKNR